MLKGYSIVRASPRDSDAIAEVHVKCWRTTYKGIVPDEKLDGLCREKSSLKWKEFFSKGSCRLQNTVLLARSGGSAAGFCAGGEVRKFSKRTEGYEGEIKAVYVLSEHQKKGLGTEFLRKFEEIFRKNGIFSYIIWVLKDNDSKNFYRKMGGKLITTKTYEIGGKKLKGLCFGFRIENREKNEL